MKNFHTENLAEIWHRAVNLYESGEGFEFGIMNDLYYQLFYGYEDPFDS